MVMKSLAQQKYMARCIIKMIFKRQLFIEDLFVPKKLLNAFELVEFESLDVFKKYMTEKLYINKNNTGCHIHIQQIEDFTYLKKLYEDMPNYFDMSVYIEFDTIDLFEEVFDTPIDENMNFSAIISETYNHNKHWKTNDKWIKKHIIALKYKIAEPTLEMDISTLLDIYNTKHIRFFLLDIDYESFLRVPLSELDRIEYWFYHLRTWMIGQEEVVIQPLVILGNRNFLKRIFIGNDLIWYLDSYKDPIWCFKLHDYLEENGNTMDTKVLNKLHTVLDLHPASFYTEMEIKNYMLISFRQILKMGYFINEIPLIMSLIQRWLYE